MRTTRLPTSICTCGKALDAARPAKDRNIMPEEGDLTVCAYCCAVWAFKEDLTLEPIDVETLPPASQKEIRQIQSFFHARRPS